MHLQDLLPAAKRAFNNTSHDPEGRGETLIKEHESLLEDDLLKLADRDGFDKEAYIAKYKILLSTYISRLSNCASSFICGASKFPVERARKANESAEKASNALYEWRVKVGKPPRVKKDKVIDPNARPDKSYQFDGFVLTLCWKEERIKIAHDAKPDFNEREKLKKAAFKWAPTNECWQRKFTVNAYHATLNLLGVTDAELRTKLIIEL